MNQRFPSTKFVGAVKVNGSLYDLGPYPGMLLNEADTAVTGEVYEVDDETLHKLDEFETSSNYCRKALELFIGAGRKPGWTYEPSPEFYDLSKLIPSGDWLAYLKTKTD